jgi:hypothetical protein
MEAESVGVAAGSPASSCTEGNSSGVQDPQNVSFHQAGGGRRRPAGEALRGLRIPGIDQENPKASTAHHRGEQVKSDLTKPDAIESQSRQGEDHRNKLRTFGSSLLDESITRTPIPPISVGRADEVDATSHQAVDQAMDQRLLVWNKETGMSPLTPLRKKDGGKNYTLVM